MTIVYVETNFLMAIAKGQDLQAAEQLNTNAKIIYLDTPILQNISQEILTEPENLLIKNDVIDNIILQCILNHAQHSSHSEQKVFISANSRDFNTPEVQDALRQARIRYFTITQHFLDRRKAEGRGQRAIM